MTYSIGRGKSLLLASVMLCAGGCATHPQRTLTADDFPKPFTTDGCTWFPDGNYRDCCEVHDRVYWCGGTRSERRASDQALAQCVAAKGHPQLSAVMYRGVRIGGVPWLPTYWRWGYGWPFGRGYAPRPSSGCEASA